MMRADEASPEETYVAMLKILWFYCYLNYYWKLEENLMGIPIPEIT